MQNQPIDARIIARLQLEERRSELILKLAANKAMLMVFRFGSLRARYLAERCRLDAEFDGLSYQLYRSNPTINPYVALSPPTLRRLVHLKILRRLA
ncbi:hypothetical protein [Spirosoma pomorum]